jgi:hypothetical protein
MPVRTSKAIAGTMICVTTCQGLAPRLRATLNQAGSTLDNPAAVENITGQTAATAIRNMMAWSQPANTMTAIGSQDSGLIMRINWKGELLSSRKRLLAADQDADRHADQRWQWRGRPRRAPLVHKAFGIRPLFHRS